MGKTYKRRSQGKTGNDIPRSSTPPPTHDDIPEAEKLKVRKKRRKNMIRSRLHLSIYLSLATLTYSLPLREEIPDASASSATVKSGMTGY
jgi:hypothetical protein